MKILKTIDPKAVRDARRFHARCTDCEWDSSWCHYVESVELVASDHAALRDHRVGIEERE